MRARIIARALGCVAAALALVSMSGCGPGTAKPAPTASPPRGSVPAPSGEARSVVAVYDGVLPCADCSGIETRLVLLAADPDTLGDATFELRETFVGTRDGERSFESRGPWVARRGAPDLGDATVYTLNPGDPSKARSFLVVDDRTVELLDRNGQRIKAGTPYVLTRVDFPAPPP